MPKKKSELAENPEHLDFEGALAELNTVIENMEQGGIALEESLKQYERGVLLTRLCQKTLQEAEQKVAILMEKNGQAELAPYDPDEQV